MINVSTITEQIRVWLRDDTDLDGFTISRGEFINEDPKIAYNGWIGIYRRDVDYDPRNLGTAPNNYEGVLTFQLVVQRVSYKSGEDAEDILEDTVKKVLDRIVQLPKTYIDTFTDLSVNYSYVETDRKSTYFQAALITLEAVVSTEVV